MEENWKFQRNGGIFFQIPSLVEYGYVFWNRMLFSKWPGRIICSSQFINFHFPFPIAQTLANTTCVHTNLDEDPDAVREEFKNFLAQVISNWTDKRDQEELSIMNN